MKLASVVSVILLFGWVRAGPKLILVMVDGVRWDYIDDPKLRGFRRIAETGVRASYLNPIYPSITYPNMYSIVTGLYAENHGFVDNLMYDEEKGSFFLSSSDPSFSDPRWWEGAEPLWITAEKQGLSTAMYWWGGCEVRIGGHHPTICERERYGPSTPEETRDFLERIDDIVEMFKAPSNRSPKDRLSLVLIYYGSVDYNGHHFGPTSLETKEALYNIDSLLDKMLSKLHGSGLQDEVNVMVVSDHGMTDISKAMAVDLEKFDHLIKYQVTSGTQSLIVPRDNMTAELYRAMKQAKMSGIEVLRRDDLPERYHMKGSERTTPIVLVANEGYLIKSLNDKLKSRNVGQYGLKGGHGYDPTKMEDMRAIFLATGPDFGKNQKIGAVNNTDLYNVMCHVLRLKPLPNNGSWSKMEPALRSHAQQPAHLSAAGSLCSLSALLTTLLVGKTLLYRMSTGYL